MRATPSSRARASWISLSPGAVFVFKLEHLLHDLPDRRQRVELAALHLVEQATQLVVARDRALEVRLRTRRRDGEHLAREVLAPPLLEQPFGLEERPVLLDLLPQLGHVLATH